MSERMRAYLYYGNGVFIGSLILSFCAVEMKKALAFETRLRALEIPREGFDYEDKSESQKNYYTHHSMYLLKGFLK